MRNVYTTKEVAELFSASPHTVRDWVLDGRFYDAVKIGNRWLYPKKTIDDLVEVCLEKRKRRAEVERQKAERRLAKAVKNLPAVKKPLDEKIESNLLILNVATDYPSRVRAAREILARLSEIL